MNRTDSKPSASSQTVAWLLALLVTTIVLFLAYLLRFVLVPFIVAGGLAFITVPVVHFLQTRLHLPRWLAALVPFLFVVGLLLLAALGIWHYAVPEVRTLVSSDKPVLEMFLNTLFKGHTLRISGQTYGAHDLAGMLKRSAKSMIDPNLAIEHVTLLFAVAMGLLMTLVLLLFLLIDGPRVKRGMLWSIPPALREPARRIAKKARPMIFHYTYGVFTIVIYTMAVTYIVTRFILKVEHPLAMSIAVGFLELIPVVGPFLSIVLIGFLAVERMTFAAIVAVTIFATGLRLSIDQVVAPLVLGRSVNLPPAVAIFAFVAGGAIWGILGVMVALPAAAIIKMILEEVYSTPSASEESA